MEVSRTSRLSPGSITLEHVTNWVASGESEVLEFKRTTGERREAARTLCAMLNNRGGRVLFGVTPEHELTGQQVSDHTIEELASELGGIDPPTFPTIDRIELGRGKELLIVSAVSGQHGPYTYKCYAYKHASVELKLMHVSKFKSVIPAKSLKQIPAAKYGSAHHS